MSATPEFERWAKGFGGCHGGNLRGSTWLCGVEWSMEELHRLDEEMTRNVKGPPQRYEAREDVLKTSGAHPHPFNILFLKLVASMRGRQVGEYRSVLNETPFPFHRKSDFLKLNLFPIAFKDLKKKQNPRLWCEFRRATGFSNADEYLEWCREFRFPRMRAWVRRGQPRLIVGVGLDHITDFQRAFGFAHSARNEENIEGIRIVWMSNRQTVLVVVPSPSSPSGLNSDKRVQAVGELLGTVVKREVGQAG